MSDVTARETTDMMTSMTISMRKRLAACLALCAALLALLPATAWGATSQAQVVLQAKDAAVHVELQLPEGAADDTRALQLSLRVNGTGGTFDGVAFDFDGAIASSVKEARYHKDTGLLTLYVAGDQNLFANRTLSLGSLKPTGFDEKEGVALAVSALPSSLRVVNGAHSESAPDFYASPDPTELVIAGTETPAPPKPPDGQPGPSTPPGTQPGPTPPATTWPTDDLVSPGLVGSEGGEGSASGKNLLENTGDGSYGLVLALAGLAAAALPIALAARRRARR